jgi:TorA maturation chaperone TorD
MSNNLQTQNLQRRFLYNLLSDIFILKPEKEFLDKIHQKDIYTFLKSFLDNHQDIKELENYITSLMKNDNRLIELGLVYENTFVIPVAMYYIPPYMSAFINYANLRSNNSFYTISEELNSLYGLYSLHFDYKSDHLSVIFSFMSYLINMDLSENISTIEEQYKFFKKYIVNWVEVFFNEVLQRCDNKFYKMFSNIGKNFIALESNLMKEV